MKKNELPIPAGILELHSAVLGTTRSGKSSKLRVLVEYLLDWNQPVCIIDPKGDWYGLKSSADGKGPGYPVVIFGGDHADIPINEHAGAAVAEVVATGNRPCIIDLGGWMVAARTRFAIEFMATLFKLNKTRRYLIVDECHNFAPQSVMLKGETPKMLHWACRLASEGAGRGILLLSASQRPQKVHKDYLTVHETLIACRMNHNLDRAAVKAWVDGCADPAVAKELLQGLANMTREFAWVWSPELGYGPVKQQWPMFKTFDSFKAPAPGQQKNEPTGWADIDLDELRDKLQTVVADAEAADPKKLRTRIAELEKSGRLDAAKIQSLNSQLQDMQERFTKASAKAAPAAQAVSDSLKTTADAMAVALQKIGKLVRPFVTEVSGEPQSMPQKLTSVKMPELVPAARSAGPMGKPEQRVLNAVAWWEKVMPPGPFTKVQVAMAAAYSPKSSNFNNLLSKLKTTGQLEYPVPGYVAFTADGRAAADPCTAPATAEELHQRIFAILAVPQIRVLSAVIKHRTLSKAQLAEAVAYSVTSSNFNNLVSGLRSLELIDYPAPGMVRAADFLYLGK